MDSWVIQPKTLYPMNGPYLKKNIYIYIYILYIVYYIYIIHIYYIPLVPTNSKQLGLQGAHSTMAGLEPALRTKAGAGCRGAATSCSTQGSETLNPKPGGSGFGLRFLGSEQFEFKEFSKLGILSLPYPIERALHAY